MLLNLYYKAPEGLGYMRKKHPQHNLLPGGAIARTLDTVLYCIYRGLLK